MSQSITHEEEYEPDIIDDIDDIECEDEQDDIDEQGDDSDGENMNLSDIYQDEKSNKIEFYGRRRGLPRHFGLTPNTSYYDNVNYPSTYLNCDIDKLRSQACSMFQPKLTQVNANKLEKYCYNNAISLNGVVKKHQLITSKFKASYVEIVGQVVCDIETHSYKDVITSLKNNQTGFSGISWKQNQFQDKLETLYIETPMNIKNGIHTCGKCKKNQTIFYQLQTRSSDEMITTFICCTNCGNRWREG